MGRAGITNRTISYPIRSSRAQSRERALSGRIHLVVVFHANGLMIVDLDHVSTLHLSKITIKQKTHMANDLPLPHTRGVHVQRLPLTIVNADGIIPEAVVSEAVAVHVEDVAGGSVGVDVPDDLVVEAHFVDGIVAKDITIHGVETGSALELPGTGEVDHLRMPNGVVSGPQIGRTGEAHGRALTLSATRGLS